MNGSVSLSGEQENLKPVTFSQDTASVLSFILESALEFSEQSYSGSNLLIHGIELCYVKVPVHSVYVQSEPFERIIIDCVGQNAKNHCSHL